MHLRRFSVSGYKNIRQPVELDELGPINLVHGPNNVGKSNLLQAMALFFRCLLPASNELPIVKPRYLASSEVEDLVSHPRELFHLDAPAQIVLSGSLDVTKSELDAVGGIEGFSATDSDIELTVEWDGSGALVRITRFPFQNGKGDPNRALRFGRFLALNELVREGPPPRFSIVGVRRDLEDDKVERGTNVAPLALEMYDCRESTDTIRRNRWRAFVRAMQDFHDVTGDGTFEVTYPRSAQTQRARLVFDTDKTRIPFRLLGTGVQQIAALLGHLLMRNATIVAVEEPELNLRWDLQNRLRDALKKLVVAPHEPGGVDQLFLTSHSPAFETGERFFLMERGSDGPVVSQRPASELASVLGSAPQHLGLPERAPQSYVTSQGVVRLPPDAIKRLQVGGGGGVVFLDAEPHGVRILSNDDYLDELGLIDVPKDADAAP